MTDLYKIKPLDWQLDEDGDWAAGGYYIRHFKTGLWGWAEMPHSVSAMATTLDEAKAAVEADRLLHLLQHLDPVPEVVAQWRTDMENAPRDGSSFVAGGWVENIYGEAWWEEHVIWLDDETGEIAAGCECPFAIEDFEHWSPLPTAPALAQVEKA